jgi:Domain of unknown function (DUF4424)
MARTVLSLSLLGFMFAFAHANDSESELAIGGLVLKQSDSISLDSEDLYLSQDLVHVKYRFTNTSDKDITTLVAFPLPDAPGEENGKGMVDFRTQLEFKTTVDGKPLQLDYVQQAFFNGDDVSARLVGIGIPLPEGDDAFHRTINALPEAARRQLIADRLIEPAGSDGNPLWTAKWTLRTTVTRQQAFPAGKTITVEHKYRPMAGGSVGGALEPDYRGEDWHKSQVRKYCIEDSWFKTFDKRRQKTPGYSEAWLGYILKSGANWKGPIRNFRMVIDKGKPETLVSFCADGVKKISSTQFEVRKTNFEPDKDVNILFINWAKPQP